MKRLYYIIAIIKKDYDDTWSRPELCFVGFQWLLFFCYTTLVLDRLSVSGKIDWYKYDEIKPLFFFAFPWLAVFNHFFLFRKKQANKIIDKYAGKYPLIDKYPGGAYFLFHLILPLVLFIIFLLLSKYLL